ncbi:MAG TPA: HAD family hydrolase [Dehalococcoidia bacterium]|nr:HAD family hydrolase [Dehalococcoidia bacterium]
MTSPAAIFFDMDGTILDWQSGMEESWLASCAAHCDGSYEPPRLHDAIRQRRTWFWGDAERAARGRLDLDAASREIVRAAFEDLALEAPELAHRIADDYRARRTEAIAPYPRALETLEAFRGRGLRLALITNGGARSQRASIERFGLARYFDCIVIEGEFGCGKPDERVFAHALATVGCDPADAWMVGDSLEADIATPHRLGMHTVWVDAADAGLPRDPPVRPHRTIRAVHELLG